MGDWKIKDKSEDPISVVKGVITFGLSDRWYKYDVENVESGERKTVTADDEYELGEKISDGDFDEVESDE
ncbi:MAG TPA: hypothetical protein VN493_26535 [Thermoanaerobaculia bacterium]|nr:hypothetical protein [Thermoanaerobaculia bacterium]